MELSLPRAAAVRDRERPLVPLVVAPVLRTTVLPMKLVVRVVRLAGVATRGHTVLTNRLAAIATDGHWVDVAA
jgi:hypothetical protein